VALLFIAPTAFRLALLVDDSDGDVTMVRLVRVSLLYPFSGKTNKHTPFSSQTKNQNSLPAARPSNWWTELRKTRTSPLKAFLALITDPVAAVLARKKGR
jgi:hypothetical protein